MKMPTACRSLLALLLAFSGASSIAQDRPDRPDETDVIRTADVFHILVPDQFTATTLLREIRSVPAAGRLEKFKDVARRASKDPGSSPSGGDLGAVHEGEMVRSFETAIFAAATGEVTAPFRSEFGWHLAYVTRRGERRVAEICRSSIEKAASTAAAFDKEGMSLALEPVDLSALPGRIAALLGDDWRGPFADKEGNPFYLKSEPAAPGDPASRRIVTGHTEFIRAKFVATAPMACARSMRQQWVVECRPPGATGWASVAEFEGRAAAGRRTMDVGPGVERAKLESIEAATMGSWLFDFACKSPAPPKLTT